MLSTFAVLAAYISFLVIWIQKYNAFSQFDNEDTRNIIRQYQNYLGAEILMIFVIVVAILIWTLIRLFNVHDRLRRPKEDNTEYNPSLTIMLWICGVLVLVIGILIPTIIFEILVVIHKNSTMLLCRSFSICINIFAIEDYGPVFLLGKWK